MKKKKKKDWTVCWKNSWSPPVCPKCNSKQIKPVEFFDYMKECAECGHGFSSNPHN